MSPEFLALQRAVAGRYSLDRELGRGGMGVVFLARDVALERPVAIKLLPPALARVPGARERFLREARMAARLSHPHIVPIHAVEQHDELAFFVMAYVDGETLGERVRRGGPLPPAELARVLREVAWALAHAHAHGIVHRDVKPENVLLERDGAAGIGRALVSDFGIATAPEPDGGVSAGRGTPAFMSPEQAAGRPIDARSDLYSLGVTAWVAATGALPWANDGARLLAWQGGAPLPRLAGVAPHVPATIAAAVDRCLAAEPSARWESADRLVDALSRQESSRVVLAAPLRRWVREAHATGADVLTGVAGSASSLAVLGVAFDFNDFFAGIVFYTIAAVFGALGLTRLVQLLAATRALQGEGFEHGAARAALLADEREQDDLHGTSRFQRYDMLLIAGAALGAGQGMLIAKQVEISGFALLGAALAVAAPTALLRHLMQRQGRMQKLWRRVLDGPVGKAIFGIAGMGMRAPALPAPYAGEPTALALGRGIDHLWQQLPAGDRAALGDVPALVQKLEARALALREGMSGDPARAERLATTVATLEAVRLDLLRLRARELDAGGMTTTLADAERVALYVDEVLTPMPEDAPRRGERTPTPRPA